MSRVWIFALAVSASGCGNLWEFKHECSAREGGRSLGTVKTRVCGPIDSENSACPDDPDSQCITTHDRAENECLRQDPDCACRIIDAEHVGTCSVLSGDEKEQEE